MVWSAVPFQLMHRSVHTTQDLGAPGGSARWDPLSSAPTPKQGEVAGLSRVSPSPHLGHRAARAVTRLQPPEWLEILPSTSPRSCWFFGHKAEQLKAQTPGLPRGCRLHSRTMLCAPGQIPDLSGPPSPHLGLLRVEKGSTKAHPMLA